MNRLTRICGLKRRHCLHELTGSMMLRCKYALLCRVVELNVRIRQWTNVYTTILRLSIITLQHDKVKDCDRHPPHYV